MVLDVRHLIRALCLVNIVTTMKAASTSNLNCPINCECQPAFYKVNCSAASVNDSTFTQISERVSNFTSKYKIGLIQYFGPVCNYFIVNMVSSAGNFLEALSLALRIP